MDGWFEVNDDVVDHAAAAMEDYRKNNKNIEPGTQLRIVNTKVDESERPEGARRPISSEDSLGDVSPGLPKETHL
jgi:hypothetical protein